MLGQSHLGSAAVQARLAAALARRPVAFLVSNLALVVAFGALAMGTPDRVSVGGGLERSGAEQTRIAVVLEPRGTLTKAVARQAQSTVESGLLADDAVAGVESLGDEEGDRVLVVTVSAATATAGQSAAERVTGRIDPGPFTLEIGGEPAVQGEARDHLEDELPGLLLLGVPLVLLVLGFAFGPRQLGAPVLAGATAALGGIAGLRALPGALDLTAAGIVVAAVVGIAVAVEACLALRRAHAGAAFAAPEAMLGECLEDGLPRVAFAGAGGALAAATLFAVPLPAAHSAAAGGVVAALLAALSAPVAMGSVIALLATRQPEEAAEPPGEGFADRLRYSRLGRIVDEVTYRPWLAWIPAALVLTVLGAATSQAFDTGATALEAADLGPDAEPARVALMIADELPAAEAADLASGAPAATALELFEERLPWILGALTILGILTTYAASRSPRVAIANGLGAALPAGAVCGAFALAGETPHATVLFATVAALGAVGVARATFADAGGALAGTLVAGAIVIVLGGAELDAIAQAGFALAAGLMIDLVLVRVVLAPCLEQALHARLS